MPLRHTGQDHLFPCCQCVIGLHTTNRQFKKKQIKADDWANRRTVVG